MIDRAARKAKLHRQRTRGSRQISREELKGDVQAWAEKIGVTIKQIHIRQMARKWASCSTTGRFSFNEELLSKAASFRKEVIIHELLHLRIPNHGKLFRALLKAYVGQK